MEFVWQSDDSAPLSAICPVCADPGPHRPIVVIPHSGPKQADWTIVQCPSCASRFSTDREGADYTPGALPGGALLEFYVEQGAGLRPMLEPLGWADVSPGRRMLEIGGGFGFTSDFVQVALGWKARGYDPSGLAALGRDYLGLDIVLDYWTDDTPLAEPYDVAYASEVVEHIPEPAGFLVSIRRAVGTAGVVVLTTPNGAALHPSTSPALLAPIASPGQHLTLFSAQGLEQALRAAGFQQVRVEERGATLHAFASDGNLPAPRPLSDALYRDYLHRRIATPGLAPALLSGLRYRLYKEMVNAGQAADALALFASLAEDVATRFGIDITDPTALRPPVPSDDVQQWLARYPGNLTGLLYYRAILANNSEGDPGAAALYTAVAALAGAHMRRVLQNVGMEDGETEVLTSAAVHLHLLALVCAGADSAPLLSAVTQGTPERGLMIPVSDRRHMRRGLRRDLRAMDHPDSLWRTARVDVQGDELDLLAAILGQRPAAVRIEAWDRISEAPDSAATMEAFRAIWTLPDADQAPTSLRHARKLTLIRLVLLGAFHDADALFDAWDQAELAADSCVETALGILAGADLR
ncbi:methyltransferase domain-containing protein [Niveispirillum sp. SYP-B3756]|uniref:methyltransferase domain-containing protein n=1 Tax=Niveispirillum sp. SYP-B3756 TaxID=2662178 RepID=UPI00129105B0|nr:methyltransferase domain-containing protein [Niveispirillum sp. SYP-B3756]